MRSNDQKLQLFLTSYADCFGIPANRDAWKLCHGIANAKGYAAKTELFSSLHIFCSSMGICCGLILLLAVPAWLGGSVSPQAFSVILLSGLAAGTGFFFGEMVRACRL